jgi:hypothetical protein
VVRRRERKFQRFKSARFCAVLRELYRSYLRVGVRGDLAIEYMQKIGDDLDAINKPEAERKLSEAPGRGAGNAAQAD